MGRLEIIDHMTQEWVLRYEMQQGHGPTGEQVDSAYREYCEEYDDNH